MTYRSLLICLLMLIAGNTVTAQDQKIGYVDTDYILSKMSEYDGVQQQLSTLSSEWNAKLQKMKEEIEALKEDFRAKEILYTDELREKKEEEIQNKVQQRQQFLDQKFGSEGEYFTKQQELLKPVQRKVFNAVNTVAQRGEFDFVFDRAKNSAMLYSTPEWNLNDEVLKELGITLNDTSN